MLTNYAITRDQRYKAAVSGAGISNMLGGFGVDHYIVAWEQEVGMPGTILRLAEAVVPLP